MSAARGDVVERSGRSVDDTEGDFCFLGKAVPEELGELLGPGGEQFAAGAGYPSGDVSDRSKSPQISSAACTMAYVRTHAALSLAAHACSRCWL